MTHYEQVLQEFVVRDNRDHLRFRKLSESDKLHLSKDMVESLFKATTERAVKVDYGLIEKTKGDITKFDGYEDLVNSLSILVSMQGSLTEKIEDLDTVNTAFKNLKDNTGNFEQGFRVGNHGVMMLYNNIATAVVASTSFIIATTLDYVKSPSGLYQMHMQANATKHKGFPTLMLQNLRQFNIIVVNGDLAKFFEYSFSKKALVGGALTIGAATAVIAMGIGFAIVPLLRELVYQFYHQRVALSDYLRLQASFVEMNRSNVVGPNMKTAASRQDRAAKVMAQLADKIDVDQKTATKKAEMEIKRENNSINMDSGAVRPAADDSYTSLL